MCGSTKRKMMRKILIIIFLLISSMAMSQRLVPIEISTDDTYAMELGDLYGTLY